MVRSTRLATLWAAASLAACAAGSGADSRALPDSGSPPGACAEPDAGPGEATDGGLDAGPEPGDAGSPDAGQPNPDGGVTLCSVNGNPGQCMDATACGALPSFSPTPGYCPGPASVQCCVLTPSVANNPPVPSGWALMQQANVTSDMTTWAVDILHSPATYPMFTAALRTFGSLTVMARVEWHPPDFQNGVVHRGVTLYQP